MFDARSFDARSFDPRSWFMDVLVEPLALPAGGYAGRFRPLVDPIDEGDLEDLTVFFQAMRSARHG